MRSRHPGRSNAEWMNLITECRQSGLSDSTWCDQHNIPPSSFYNAVSRLRKMAFAIPDPADKARTAMDFTAKQEVVKIDIVPDHDVHSTKPISVVPAPQELPEHLDNSHKIEIILDSASIRICNGADPALLDAAIRTLRAVSC